MTRPAPPQAAVAAAPQAVAATRQPQPSSLRLLQSRRHELTPNSEYLVLVMVGLPARGKSFISLKLRRFLQWRGQAVRIFNVGERRREKHGLDTKHDHAAAHQGASFFSPSNLEYRNQLAQGTLEEMEEWLLRPAADEDGVGGRAAIFDATNSNKARRRQVVSHLQEHVPGCAVLFVESVCDDVHRIHLNLLQKVRNSRDYKHMPEEEALADLRARIQEYEKQYETCSPQESLAFIKLFNLSSRLQLNHIYGRAAKSLVPYMMGIHVGRRPILLVRAAHCHGASSPSSVDSATPVHSPPAQRTGSSGPWERPRSHSVGAARPAAAAAPQSHSVHGGSALALRRGDTVAAESEAAAAAAIKLRVQIDGIDLTDGGALRRSSSPGDVSSAGCSHSGSAGNASDGGGGATPSEPPRPPQPRSNSVVVPRSATLSATGMAFAQRLGAFIASQCKEVARSEPELEHDGDCAVFTSTLPRAMQTAAFVPTSREGVLASSALNPLDKGAAYGLTEDEFEAKMPEEHAAWRADPRHNRFPGGESYQDLVMRVEPLLIELEQQTSPVLVVAHLTTLQVLLAYFTGCSLDQALRTSIPMHSVLQLTPSPTEVMWEEKVFALDEAGPPAMPVHGSSGEIDGGVSRRDT